MCFCESLSSVHLLHQNYKENMAYFPSCALSHLPMVTVLGLKLQLILEEVEYTELVSGAEVI